MEPEVWAGIAEPVRDTAVSIFASSIPADVPKGENAICGTDAWTRRVCAVVDRFRNCSGALQGEPGCIDGASLVKQARCHLFMAYDLAPWAPPPPRVWFQGGQAILKMKPCRIPWSEALSVTRHPHTKVAPSYSGIELAPATYYLMTARNSLG
jgi:hypothetical protein